jgi:hypothetical protein
MVALFRKIQNAEFSYPRYGHTHHRKRIDMPIYVYY